MLRIVPSTSAEAAQRYFDSALARGDYYLDGEEMAGAWGGRASEMLGLSGEVTREAFHALCENLHPGTGERLTARTRSDRRVGYDFNFHCPKHVSAVYALTGDERILDAFRSAVRETMQELERDTECRVRDGGQNGSRVTGNMLWSEFIHLTTRPVDGVPDPHLHAHCFVQNVTWDKDHRNRDGSSGMWKAGDFAAIKRDARYFEAAFHARFAGRMAAMGYPVARDGRGFWDIAGIPDTVRDKFSRRTAEIEALASELGILDADRKAELGARSREAKAKGTGLARLRDAWGGRLSEEERAAIWRASEEADGTPRHPEITVGHAASFAAEHLFERRSAVSDRDFAEAALRRGVGAVSVGEVWQRVEGLMETGTLLSGRVRDRTMVTTRQVLAEEREMLGFAREGRGACSPLGRPDYAFQDPLFQDPAKDTAEQRAAIRHVLGSHDRVIAVRGAAGTGKTTMMREVAAGIRDSGHRIFAFAPTAEASRGVLRQEGFAEADTVEQLLRSRELQQKVRGQVLWIDEAGLLGARALCRLFRVADAQGCRVILSGDTRQHAPVERGDGLRILENQGGIDPIAITRIQRQRVHSPTEPASIRRYRAAVKHLSEGDPSKGFAALDAMGAVTELDIDLGPAARHQRIAADYLEAVGGRNLKSKPNAVLVVSPTHAEGDAVTAAIRDGLKSAGKIGTADRRVPRLVNLNWTEAERADTAKYRPGQVVQFHQNVKGGFSRGGQYEVVQAGDAGIRVKDTDGVSRTLPLASASRFSVFDAREASIARGDMIRITQNGFTNEGHRLNNGAQYRVKDFTGEGDIRLENGWVIGAGFGHLAHGYVTTSHASQGKTADVVLIAQSAQSLPASNLEQFYVSVSRGRERVHVYTDDKEALRDAIARSIQRVAASEVAGTQQSAREDDRLRRRRYQRVVNRWRETARRISHGKDMDRID